MGAGRKTQTLTLAERIQHAPSTVNGSASARNLRKNDLGGVIFGCTHSTMRECLSNQIFGLPSIHYSYIKNIEPGLPLFLFNYSDRKLHGIFEAASHGQMNINPYGWSADGSERTQYPAQVRICIRMQCQPLSEKQYNPIISDNYHSSIHFWFELDHAQTGGLISLFTTSPVTVTAFLQNAPKRTLLSRVVPNDDTKQENEDSKAPVSWEDFPPLDLFNMESGVFPKNVSKWRTLDEANPAPKRSLLSGVVPNDDTRQENEDSKTPVSWEDFPPLDLFNMESGVLPKNVSKWRTLDEANPDPDARNEDELNTSVSKKDFAHSNQFNMESGSAGATPSQDEENEMLENHLDKEAVENEEDLVYLKLKQLACDRERSNSNPKDHVEGISVPCVRNEMHLEDKRSPASPLISAEKYEEVSVSSSDHQSVIDQLRQGMEELKAFSLEQLQKTSALEKKLAESDMQLQQLKARVELLESQLDPSPACVDEPLNESHVNESLAELFDEADDLIFLIGGFNGLIWLSALDAYSPSRDIVRSCRPMSSVRSYASAAKLKDDIYIFGGGNGDNGNLWYNTVESYNPSNNEWTSRPPLIERKGSLAGATLHDKIYAIGGGNGVECFSGVEMFDPTLGRWIRIQSMLQKRFAPAAAELHGALYVVGGYDGNSYLKSAERFDPREVSWSRLQSMNTSRGCHSLAILNEKLYALGGYDGTKTVQSVEVFDPRTGSWMAGDEMKQSRGYSATTVIGETIYAIGGLKDGKNVADTVECYKEGYGWWVTNSNAVGRRCFFSAVAL